MTAIPDTTSIANLLSSWLESRLEAPAWAWMNDRLQRINPADRKTLFLTFGLTSRKTGKGDLNLTDSDVADAARVRPGWQPQGWSVDQAARILFLLRFPASTETEFLSVLEPLIASAEVHELVALYQGLPLYPFPEYLRLICADGLRTNIPAVFKAIAHDNPYPSEQLTDDQWNQMVLKCFFIGATLDPIVGLDARANPSLARMFADFAQERRAAGRPVSPELWRCVGPFADEGMLDELERVLTTGTELERQAAALALASCPHPRAAQMAKSAENLPQARTWGQIAAGIAANGSQDR